MPFSSQNGKEFIRKVVNFVRHEKILDIGCGAGAYAKMFPQSECTGIEVWEPYVDQYSLHEFYQNLIIADAREIDYEGLGKFDVAIAGDVLEHMTEDDARELVERLKKVADTVIISVPLGHYPQDEWGGNPYEKHIVDDWTDEKVRDVFGEPRWSKIEGEIGVYVWSNRKLKIAVYAISKNEEKFVKRFCESAKGADLVLIADTGSTDDTVRIAKECGAQVHEICITPWRFDHARMVSLGLLPKHYDVCVMMDLDEVLEEGWREEIERLWAPDITRMGYIFDWGHGVRFNAEKIHARHGYYWHHPCHEYPKIDARVDEVVVRSDKLLISHYPDEMKGRGQYLDLLELSVKEDPYCPRNAFYYARELYFYGRNDEAIERLEKYLAMPNATWHHDRSYAMRVMSECFERKNDWQKAEMWALRAAAEAPYSRDPWCRLAQFYYNHRRWEECLSFARRALTITFRELVYTCDPKCWGALPHDLAAIALWNLGRFSEGLEEAQKALAFAPFDARLQANVKFFEEKLAPLSPDLLANGEDIRYAGA